MSTPRICPTCEKPVPTDAPHDVCPACLLQGGFATGSMDSGVPGSKPRFTAPTLDELTPLFPQLELIEFIGQGGMGAVYKARQRELGRLVALKILPPGIGDDPTFAERFTREARALAQLNHPGIVTLYEFGKVGQASSLSPATPDTPETAPRFLYYFLMEFVDGVNLRQLLRTERVSPREALAIVPQICDALQFAHDQGIVHRDIKPENILLDRRGRVKVADFGLAKLVGNEAPLIPSLSPSDGERVADRPGEEATALTAEGKVMGTPHYMAPEQSARPAEVDHRADIYALGVVFYQMLTGELPDKQLQPPSKKVQIDVRLDEIVLRALERNPDRRYQQVSQMKTGVESLLSAAPAHPRTSDCASKIRTFDSHKPTLSLRHAFWCLAIALISGVVFFVFASAGLDHSDRNWVSTARIWLKTFDPAKDDSVDTFEALRERTLSAPSLEFIANSVDLKSRWPELNSSDHFVSTQRIVERLRGGIQLAHVAGTRIVRVGYAGFSPDEVSEIVNALTITLCDKEEGKVLDPASVPRKTTISPLSMLMRFLFGQSAQTHRPISTTELALLGLFVGAGAGIVTALGIFLIGSWKRWGIDDELQAKAPSPGSTSKSESQARLSLALFLAGTLGTLLLMTLSYRHDMALLFGSVALMLALVFGCLSWRQRMGKSVAIATMILAAGLGITVMALVWTPPWSRSEAEPQRQQAIRRLQTEQSAKMTPPGMAASYPFGQVEVLAVADYQHPNTLWGADGHSTGPTGFHWPRDGLRKSRTDQERLRKIAFKVTRPGAEGMTSIPILRFGSKTGITNAVGIDYEPDGGSDTSIFYAHLDVAPATESSDISLGLADGPWETVVTISPPQSNWTGDKFGSVAEGGYWLLKQYQTANGTVCWSSKLGEGWQSRILMTHRDGSADPQGETGTVAGELGEPVDGRETVLNGYPVSKLSDLAKVELQRRAIHWVKFENVAMRPKVGAAVGHPAAGTFQPEPDYDLIQYRLVAEADDTNSPVDIVSLSGPTIEPRELRVLKEVGMDGRSIAKARLVSWDSPDRQIKLTFTKEGTQQFADLTRTNKGRQLATFSRDRLDTVSVISSEIGVGKGSLFLKATESEATDRVWRLNQLHSKSAPATLEGTLLLEANGPNESPVGTAGLLDLDTGEVIRWPAEMGDWNGTKLDRWIVESGADLLTISSQPSSDPAKLETKLVSATTLLVQLDEAAWDKTPSRSEILRLIEQGAPSLCLDPKNENAVFPNPLRLVDLSRFLPITAAFRTAEGTVGVIQFLGTNKKPRGFNVRHKTLPPIIAEDAP
jgi:serine/threonine protein kinase